MKRKGTARRSARSGFTLVELIVVIAVMGILAAVGTVAYNGYVKSVNKKADKALVGNIERALETGVNSYTFTSPETQQLSEAGAQIPIGMVVLSSDGSEADELKSATTSSAHVDENVCVPGTIEIWGVNVGQRKPFGTSKILFFALSIKKYEISNVCLTHTDFDKLTYKPVDYFRDFESTYTAAKGSSDTYNGFPYKYPYAFTDDESYTGDKLWSDYYKKDAGSNKLTFHPDVATDGIPTNGTVFSAYSFFANKSTVNMFNSPKNLAPNRNALESQFYYVDQEHPKVAPGSSDAAKDKGKYKDASTDAVVLDDMLKAAFGDNYAESLKLKYNDWNKEDSSVSTYYAQAQGSWNEVTTLMNAMFDTLGANETKLGGTQIIGKGYSSEEAMITEIAGSITHGINKTTNTVNTGNDNRAAFLTAWSGAPASNNTDYAFGLANGQNREIYCAARKLYNDAFASYIAQYHSPAQASTHANQIRGYGDTVGDLASDKAGGGLLGGLAGWLLDFANSKNVYFPRMVCESTFDGTSGFQSCKECHELYKKYIKSEAHAANGEAIYDMMSTIDATSATAISATGGNATKFYQYYRDQYLTDFSKIYGDAATAAKAGNVSIVVFSQDGKLDFQVIPSSADPRGK